MSLSVHKNATVSILNTYSNNKKETTTSVNVTNVSKNEQLSQTTKLTAEEEMILFKKEFYQDLEKIQHHRTVKNAAVNVSDKAFEKMQKDPEYREKILSLVQRDLGSSYAPRDTSVLLTVGATLDQYRGDSWPTSNDSEFFGRTGNSFFKKTDDKYDDKKLDEEAYLKRLREQQFFAQQFLEQQNQLQESAKAKSEEDMFFLKATQKYTEIRDLGERE